MAEEPEEQDETSPAEDPGEDEDAELYAMVAPKGRSPSRARASSSSSSSYADEEEQPFHEIEFMHDVPLTLSVEIGQTTLTVKEILGLNVGSSIEFTKVVGEPMDITVSGRLMARGEIVVVNERYGVRISEVTRPDETDQSGGPSSP